MICFLFGSAPNDPALHLANSNHPPPPCRYVIGPAAALGEEPADEKKRDIVDPTDLYERKKDKLRLMGYTKQFITRGGAPMPGPKLRTPKRLVSPTKRLIVMGV